MKQEFLRIYDTTVDEVYGYCYQKLGDRELAKAITQDTYTKMWSSIKPGYPLNNARMILHGIASRYIRQHEVQEQNAYNQFITSLKFS